MAVGRRKRWRDLRLLCGCYQAGKFAAVLLALQAFYLGAAVDEFSGSGSGFTSKGTGKV